MTLDTHLVMWILIFEVLDFFITRWEWHREYRYDADKDLKKQKRSRTTKKTVTEKDGGSTVEEVIETSEPISEEKK